MNITSTFETQREFPFLPAEVYRAFEDPVRLATWWGPEGFTNTFAVFEFRVGGKWSFVMHGPDGTNYPNESEFVELEANKQIVIRHVSQPHFSLTVTLLPSPAGTLLKWSQAFDDLRVAQAVRAIVEPANEQNLDRLERVLKAAP
jgi:uncharacterized protein YndB with AHSA1/START domain